MIATRRARHMLVAKLAIEHLAAHGRLPKSRALALIGTVHPATARRWLADIRAVIPSKASALRLQARARGR